MVKYYSIFFLLIFGVCSNLFSAGLRIFAPVGTYVVVNFDNGKQKAFKSQSWDIPKEIDAVCTGFSKVSWMLETGELYTIPLTIKGYKGWYTIIIDFKRVLLREDILGQDHYIIINAAMVKNNFTQLFSRISQRKLMLFVRDFLNLLGCLK